MEQGFYSGGYNNWTLLHGPPNFVVFVLRLLCICHAAIAKSPWSYTNLSPIEHIDRATNAADLLSLSVREAGYVCIT